MNLELFAKPFPTERKPSKCPTKEKNRERKQKKQGGEKAKGKRRGGREAFSKNNEILLSAYARTSRAVIWHQARKLV